MSSTRKGQRLFMMEYDFWFDDEIPKAQYGSLQCWIANEQTQPWSNVYDMTIHSIMYEIATKNGLLLGGASEENLARGCD